MEYISDWERTYAIGQEPYALATNELIQAEETGHDVSALRAQYDKLEIHDEAELMAVYDATPHEPVDGWTHFEGSDLEAIVAQLPEPETRPAPTGDDLRGRITGAWYGRVSANMLGKPVEFGWERARMKEYLEGLDAYPLTDYVPIVDESKVEELGFMLWEGLSRGRVDGGVRDDDVDYTVLGLHLLETYGVEFTTRDVAVEWLTRFPAYQVFTAERATYQNLIREVPLEHVGEFHNPFREWIGALIRADIYGYVRPGDPRAAALLAYKDAVLSHRANGIYGEMWAAALISSAFVATSPEDSIELSLQHVPPTSRLAVEISTVLQDFRDGLTWEQSLDKLDARYADMHWVHTINNAGALAAAILWGGGDYTTTIALSVQAGLDTDSIGASAGSWAGIYAGFAGIPSHWTEPLHDRTVSALFGFGEIAISDMVDRTLAVMGKEA